MLYSEFIDGTGCRDNEHNYEVYKNLEVMYMNSDMSKAEIYEYGKKLVDNSKTERELQIEAEVREEIKNMNDEIAYYKWQVEIEFTRLNDWADIETAAEQKEHRRMMKHYKDEIRIRRCKIRTLRAWFLK